MRSGTHTTAGFALALLLTVSCSDRQATQPPAPAARPSILLVTLDTTRADAIGPGAKGIETPAFNALAARGRHFRQAYATVPETLPSHISMMTGLYPGRPRRARERAVSRRGPGAARRVARTRRLSDGRVRLVVRARRAASACRAASSITTTSCRAPPTSATRRRRPTARSPTSRSRIRPRRCSSGSTTSIPTRPTNRRRDSGPATPRPTWARWPPSTSSSGA